MATIHIILCINHRGRFERGPGGLISFTGGEVTEINRVNVDTLNVFFISDLLKDIEYTSESNFYWQEPGKELDDGLRDLRVDMDVVRMYEAAVKNGNKINIYTEHPVDQPVLVEENNLTPSKRRIKTCAKRVPTPNKSPKRRLLVVEDHDDAKIVGNVQVRKEDQIRGEAQDREEVHEENKQAEVEAQKEDSLSMPQETADPPLASSHEAGQVSQPPPTPVLPDQPPSSQSQPSQPPFEEDPAPQSQANVSKPVAPKQLTQYTPQPCREL
ncbi:protein PRRC2A-like [Arachis ipaensis]|uniref:protein PRRC2A-like n=1 Tax=Arachis ipaensis TaxID=130454 RepID=UPI000A2B046D|nr:protein PRRC2A-like [Arachis ipaensis]